MKQALFLIVLGTALAFVAAPASAQVGNVIHCTGGSNHGTGSGEPHVQPDPGNGWSSHGQVGNQGSASGTIGDSTFTVTCTPEIILLNHTRDAQCVASATCGNGDTMRCTQKGSYGHSQAGTYTDSGGQQWSYVQCGYGSSASNTTLTAQASCQS